MLKRIPFSSNNDYKPSTRHISDPLFVPLAIINDIKAQKNGTKKTVFWVKKKQKSEDGTVKGEKWMTSQQYIGDWKENKKHGYGIKIYDNKDKYEGYWDNDLRNGKGTYWVCIGKNKYRKLYTGDWKNNKKEGNGIYFYKDGSCYDGCWKNSKRHGKGLMIYANEDIYEGNWAEDLKDGYGILEKKCGDKYYGYWNLGMKEGQGYYFYMKSSKIYLGEWHEDNPRCGIFTDVDDENMSKDYTELFKQDPKEVPSEMPQLRVAEPEAILEESINNIHFIRNIKMVKNKNLQELFSSEHISEITRMYNALRATTIKDEEQENKVPDFCIAIPELKKIIYNNLSYALNDQTIELIYYALHIPLKQDSQIDFLLFVKIFYLIYEKNKEVDEEENQEEKNEEDVSQNDVMLKGNEIDETKKNYRYLEEGNNEENSQSNNQIENNEEEEYEEEQNDENNERPK